MMYESDHYHGNIKTVTFFHTKKMLALGGVFTPASTKPFNHVILFIKKGIRNKD